MNLQTYPRVTPQLTPEPRLLIVEDDEGIRDAMKLLFEMVSIEASWASTGAEAVEVLNTRLTPPTLIILDGRLPDTHGLYLAKQLRPHLPDSTSIYLFSAESRRTLGNDLQFAEAGINGFIEKPFDADEFLALALRHAVPFFH